MHSKVRKILTGSIKRTLIRIFSEKLHIRVNWYIVVILHSARQFTKTYVKHFQLTSIDVSINFVLILTVTFSHGIYSHWTQRLNVFIRWESDDWMSYDIQLSHDTIFHHSMDNSLRPLTGTGPSSCVFVPFHLAIINNNVIRDDLPIAKMGDI